MPLPPSSTDLPRAQKPKIGFSIDSIVGGEEERTVCTIQSTKSHPNENRSEKYTSDDNEQYSQTSSTPSPEPSFTDISDKTTTAKNLNPFTHLHNQNQFLNNNSTANSSNISHVRKPIILPNHHLLSQGSNNSSPLVNHSSRITSPSSTTTNTLSNHPNTSNNRIISSSKDFRYNSINSDGVTTTSSPSPPPHPTNPSRSPSPLENSNDSLNTKSPIPLSSPHAIPQDSHHHLQNPTPRLHHPLTPHSHLAPHLPPIGPHGMPQFAGYPPGMLNFAAVAAAAAVQHHQHPGLPGWMPPGGPHPPPNHHPFYPWLLTKHSRLFPHRFGPGM